MKKIINTLPKKSPVIIHSNLLILDKKILLNKAKLKKIFLSNFKKGLFIPSFNLTEKKNIRFDKYENSMGSLTNLFIKDNNFKRTINPVHSYIYNNFNLNNQSFKNSSFGKTSIFNYFTINKFFWINFGAENNAGYTIFHHAEEMASVKYRKYVFFKKCIFLKNKKIAVSYRYYSRKKTINYNFDKAVRDMIQKKIIKSFSTKNGIVSFGKCNEITDFLCNKLSNNERYLIK